MKNTGVAFSHVQWNRSQQSVKADSSLDSQQDSLSTCEQTPDISRPMQQSAADPELCDIRFPAAGGCHLKASLHPHILTFCKHVWLYRLTLPPSGRSTQAGGRHAALCERAHSLAPGDAADVHLYFHHLYSPKHWGIDSVTFYFPPLW